MTDTALDLAELAVRLPKSGLTVRGWHNRGTGGPPTLCLHGVLDNCASFVPFLERAGDLDLTAIDLPGHGRSDPIGSVTCNYYDYVAAILEFAQLQGWDTFRLIGHSMGGALSTVVAGAHPEKVSKLVLIDALGPAAVPADETRTTVARYLRAFLDGREAPRYRSIEQAVHARMQLADILLDTAERLVERDLVAVGDGYSWRTDPRIKYPPVRTFGEEQVLAFIRAITAPTLLISATRTSLVEDYYPRRIASVPDLRHVTVPGSHHVHMENAGPVTELITKFLGAGN
ncbi:alpha/beta hydrolase [Streptomyces axinellae]|uniref:Alpha/beta hydrolase n=1 Tax=Streptomyces axinellae TaxID=552788 RepID=A0ABP6D312_9ACTN